MINRKIDERVKALQAHMAFWKKDNDNALAEWEMSCNTNSNRGYVV